MAATMTSPEVFLDASYAIALASARDRHHVRAQELAQEVATDRVGVVTTEAVLAEVANALAAPPARRVATAYLQALRSDPAVEVVPVTTDLFWRGFELYSERPDKGWGLTDCVSFVVMAQRGLTEALTADQHFVQAGFWALLR